MLSQYLSQLSTYFLLKLEGVDISTTTDSLLMPLVESRILLEKLDSLDYKYEYQIEKMLRVATMGRASSTSSALQRFKPRPDQIISKFDAEESLYIFPYSFVNIRNF